MAILYVDDDPMNLFIFEKMFSSKYRVLTADSGFKGLDIIEEGDDQIKLIVSDMRMPEMNGIEFLTRAKALQPELKCFILSGFSKNNEIESALSQGLIDNYFNKPFSQDQMSEVFNEVNDV